MLDGSVGDSPSRASVVLVVDDNEGNRLASGTALEGDGYRVLFAKGGCEALRIFETERPDCILLDVRMHDLDGIAACERIRTMVGGQEIPILFVTALRDVDTFDRALAAGADDFLTKPLNAADLLARVGMLVRVRRTNAQLREQVAALKEQRDALLRASLQKERLMAFVIHDLKNPVNAIDLHAQVLLRDHSLSPALRDSATMVRAGARRLTRMILDLLDVSRGDEGSLIVKTSLVDAQALVSAALAELTVTARSYEVELVSAVQVEGVVADEDLLGRALTNLVENALRHAPRGSVVTLRVVSGAFGTDFSVADAGTGVAPALRERVFDSFVQLSTNASTSAHAGRGLGLAFCKLVAAAHGGSIRVEDASPGAIFCLRIPPPPNA